MSDQFPPQLARFWRVGYAADPAIDILLDKARLAQIKVRQLELTVKDLQAQIDLTNMEISALKEEYKLK